MDLSYKKSSVKAGRILALFILSVFSLQSSSAQNDPSLIPVKFLTVIFSWKNKNQVKKKF